MLEGRYQRGFSNERLAECTDPRVRKDETGYYTMSLSENTKVYFDDFYRFLELTYDNAQRHRDELTLKIANTPITHEETMAYYRAKTVIVDILMKAIRRFYCDGGNFGIVMTPWCFGTVVLEKIEVYKERLSKGEVDDPNIPEYPFYVIKYIEEIYKVTLLELFDFPENAFHMRWQYSELLRRYSKILTNITDSLNSVLNTVKNYGS
ncbi:MAG: hypothetical protein AB1483_00350 [Candidatus Zixiibacteriota bacterium]